MIKKCSIRWCRYFSRFGFNFANLPLLGSCTVIALKHLMVVSSMWPIGPLVHSVLHERKMTFFELCISPALRQDQDIWNFYSSLTLNNGKLI